jgi:hypothetical protein
MFFTDPATGHRHGYYDGWDDDGFYNYVGEGQRGDQQFTQGNKTILQHQREGRTLEGFTASGTEVTYLGEFRFVDFYLRDAHESGDESTLRQVIVFRLEPLAHVPVDLPRAPVTPRTRHQVDRVGVEEQHTERGFVSPNRQPHEFERVEAGLVQQYRRALELLGHEVDRLRIVPAGEAAPLYSDLWDETARELVEAKGTVTREQVRYAVGQLLDYGRFADAKTKTLLVPQRPRADLLAYLYEVGVDVVYPAGDGWVREIGRPKAE